MTRLMIRNGVDIGMKEEVLLPVERGGIIMLKNTAVANMVLRTLALTDIYDNHLIIHDHSFLKNKAVL